MTNTVSIQLRIPKPLAERLQRVARECGEPRNAIVKHAIWQAVASLETRTQFIRWMKAEQAFKRAENEVRTASKSRLRHKGSRTKRKAR